MSLTVLGRSTAVLLLAAGSAASARAAGFVTGSPVWRDTSAVQPCSAGLTVRVPVRRPATPPPTTAYAVEATLRVVDGRGYARVVSDGVALRNPDAAVILFWDGLVASNGVVSPAARGSATATLDLTLVSLSPKAGAPARTVLETYRTTATVTVGAAGATCSAWAARSAGFAAGEHGRVVVNGRETTLLPRASWRGDRLVGVSGNLAHPARADLEAVIAFIHACPDLFGEVAGDQFHLESLGRDPTGITRLTASQRTRSGSPALDGRITALFDADARLIALTGPVIQGVYELPFEFPVSEATALANVTQELRNRGYDPAPRSVRVRQRVVAGFAPSLQVAYLIDVGPGPSARPDLAPGTVPEPTDWHTFTFVVSGQTGLITDAWTRSSPNWVRGSVNTVPMADAGYLDPLLAPSSTTPSGAPPLAVVNRPVWLDAVAAGGQYHLLDHYRPGSILDDVRAAVVRMPALGCADVCWLGMYWPTFDLAPWTSPPNPAHLPGFHSTLMRGFAIIQESWDSHYAAWLGAQPGAPLSLWSHTEAPGFPLPGSFVYGAYSFNDGRGGIWLSPVDYFGTAEVQRNGARTAAHELFHHFDELTVGLRRRDGDAHFMPTALKEGLAEFTGKAGFGSYPIDNTHHIQLAGTLSATVCSFAALFGNYWTCFDDLHDRFRVQAVGFYPFHRPMVQGRSLLEPWPDCRAQPQPLVDCHVALSPGLLGGTYVWTPHAPTHASEYELVAQALLDAWESSTSAVASASSGAQGRTYGQDVFPNLVLGAFVTLPPDASFLDLRDALVMQAALDPFVTATLPASAAGVPVAEIEAAFDRHGMDASLRQFCQGSATQAFCH